VTNQPPRGPTSIMKNLLFTILGSAIILTAGCSTLHKKDTASLQGMWKGSDTAHPTGTCSLTFSKNTVEFQAVEQDDWAKGIFSLREETTPKQLVGTILQAPDPKAVGLTIHAIYKLEGGTLTVVGNTPGNPDAPASFDAPGVRTLVLKKP
jgi:uncharacterized protein (TIGR03067 family)